MYNVFENNGATVVSHKKFLENRSNKIKVSMPGHCVIVLVFKYEYLNFEHEICVYIKKNIYIMLKI